MEFKEFGENAEIEYSLTVTVNGEEAIVVSAFGEESLLEELRKVDRAIADTLQSQYEDLPENIEED